VSESRKIRSKVMPYFLEGRSVMDLGCGNEKIVPWAFGVDDSSEWKEQPSDVDLKASVDPASRALDFLHQRPCGGYFDVVFSSHTLEHIPSPIAKTLHYWFCFVKPKTGRLILYLPDETRYVYHPLNVKARNPVHFHYLTYDTFFWHLDQISGIEVEKYERDVDEGFYSFLAVVRRG